MKKFYCLPLMLMLCFVAVLSSKAQNIVPIDTFRTNLQSIIDNATANYGMDGIELSIIIDDSVATETFYSGLRAPGIPVDTSKPWHYAQAAAGYTNYIALKLIEDTLMSMDDSIGMHMNASAMGLDGSITVRQLITHTSVLSEYWLPGQARGCYFNIWNSNLVGCPIDLIACFDVNKTAAGAFDNNNANLLVLQFLIDSVSPTSYETEVQNRIFTPFGMTESYLSACDTVTIDSINGIWTTASGYANNLTYLRYFSTNGGNRGLISKSYEVAKFYRSLFQDKLFPLAVMDSIKAPIAGSTIPQGSYSCASSIKADAGYNTDILEIIDNLGDTVKLYGKGGFGLNGHFTFHWPEKDWTLSLAHNDRSRQLEHRNIAVDLYCYLRGVDSVSSTLVGIEEFAEQELNFYPNPTKGILNIDLPNSTGEYTYYLVDISGKILRTELGFKGTQIDVSDLSPGVYLLRVDSDTGIFSGKFAKQ